MENAKQNAIGILICHAASDTSSVWQTDTIQVCKGEHQVASVVFDSHNKDNPWQANLEAGANYKIDITRTCYSSSQMPLPMFWRGTIEIHNVSGENADLQMLPAHHPFDTVAHMRFSYLGLTYSFDNTSHIVIDDHGPNPPAPPVVYTRQIITDHGQYWVPNNIQVWHEDGDPSRQGYFNCVRYVNNTQCLPGMISCRDSMATCYCTDKFRYDSQGNLDLMSLVYDWDTSKVVGPFN